MLLLYFSTSNLWCFLQQIKRRTTEIKRECTFYSLRPTTVCPPVFCLKYREGFLPAKAYGNHEMKKKRTFGCRLFIPSFRERNSDKLIKPVKQQQAIQFVFTRSKLIICASMNDLILCFQSEFSREPTSQNVALGRV